jgi:hypothetical protein
MPNFSRITPARNCCNAHLEELKAPIAGLVEHLAIGVRPLLFGRSSRLLSGSDAVEKLPDQAKRINLIVVLACREAQ